MYFYRYVTNIMYFYYTLGILLSQLYLFYTYQKPIFLFSVLISLLLLSRYDKIKPVLSRRKTIMENKNTPNGSNHNPNYNSNPESWMSNEPTQNNDTQIFNENQFQNQAQNGQNQYYNQPQNNQNQYYNQPQNNQNQYYKQPQNNQNQYYNQSQYGQNQYYNQPQRQGANKLAIASFVISILSVILCCCSPYVMIIGGITSITLAVLSKRDTGRMHGLAIAGLVISIIFLVLAILTLIMGVFLLGNTEFINTYREILIENGIDPEELGLIISNFLN